PGVTGEHFHEMTVDALAAVMQHFDAGRYDPVAIRQHAERFDSHVFEQQISAFVDQAWDAFRHKQPFLWDNPVVI
ncbi:MAG: hypothetical protein K8L99_06850, partial [Anaerolineae bacterium]|nr:hypothetical protein [Anaerolineae bacterium]